MFRGKTVLVLVVIVFIQGFYYYAVKGDPKIFHAALSSDNSISLHWTLNYHSKIITFEIHTPPNFHWFALGFSDRGAQFPADYCLLWTDSSSKIRLQDTYADEDGVVHLDHQQDCDYFQIHNTHDVTKFSFRRNFDTCDWDDYIIEGGTTHVVWSKGLQRLYQVNGFNISTSSGDDHGMVRVDLLENTFITTALPAHVFTLDVLTQSVMIPPMETTYWCHVFKLPKDFLEKKHHIYQYESHIQESSQGIVHHMEVFHCQTNPTKKIPLYSGNCFDKARPEETQVCKRVLAAWAMGAPAFVYPEEASLPLGGPDFNPYIMLEIHYNNPAKISHLVDSSGFRFSVSSVLKKIDAGVMELGLEYTDKMAIPPGQNAFPLTGYCISSCTAMGLPENGIKIFGSQLHTHLTGVKVYTRHLDEHGNELLEVNRDNHFSTHFQKIRRLKRPVKVLPGHILITTCYYNTQDRPNVTLGGFGITDEMCVNYIHYYPYTELEVCKSSISDQALQTFFRYMSDWEGQPTFGSTSENYQAIQWNKMRVELLREVYGEAPLSMQCNMSNGDRFPGYWENAHIPAVLTPLPPPKRQCEGN